LWPRWKREENEMGTLRDRLAALFEAIVQEAEGNRAFAQRLERALSAVARTGVRKSAGTDGADPKQDRARRSNRRAKAALDPFEAFEKGEEQLRAALEALDIEQLKDVVAEHGMDRSRLALKWKSPERLIDLIVSTVKSRASKGSAFRVGPNLSSQPPTPAPSEAEPREDDGTGSHGAMT